MNCFKKTFELLNGEELKQREIIRRPCCSGEGLAEEGEKWTDARYALTVEPPALQVIDGGAGEGKRKEGT